jgi:hypothetical protein
MAGWMAMTFGTGSWTLWYGSLFIALLMLLGTGVYACLDPEGPSAGPMLMLMVFVVAFCVMLIVTSIDVGLFFRAAGSGTVTISFFVLVSWIGVVLLWTFLFWATDPNYPHLLVPGRVLFLTHSFLLYGGNLWLLWQIRRR